MVNYDAWDEWVEYRQVEKKKKIGPMAERKQQRFLQQYPPPIQQEIIDQSIMNSWQGLFAPKGRQMVAPTSTRGTNIMDDLTDTSWAD
jgi:hypothetical protein